MTHSREVWIVAGGAALFGLLAGLCLAGMFSASSSDLAAWVQGIGSVAAIGVAIWIDQGSARRLRDDRKQEAREQLQAAEGALDQARFSVHNAKRVVAAFIPGSRPDTAHVDNNLTLAMAASGAALQSQIGQVRSPSLVAALTQAEKTLSGHAFGRGTPIIVHDERDKGQILDALTDMERNLAAIIDGYRAGI